MNRIEDLLKNFSLGFGQIILWGGSFFILSLLADPIINETGWSHPMVYGALSFAMLISGLIAPKIGMYIQLGWGKQILKFSGFVMALGLILLGISSSFTLFSIGWLFIGIGMGMGLYDPLFATLGKKYGTKAKTSIVQVTLISGFTTTVTWAFVSFCTNGYGWRNACFIYAAVLALLIFPLHQYALGKKDDLYQDTLKNKIDNSSLVKIYKTPVFKILLCYFTLGSVLMTGMYLHLIDFLINKGLTMTEAVAISALLGPSQVGVRVLDLILPKKTPIETAVISSIGISIGFCFFLCTPKVAFLGIVFFGLGNGMRSILRGTLPLHIFGQENYAPILGKLARLPLIAQALTPFLGGLFIQFFDISSFLYLLCILAVLNIVLVLGLRKTIAAL